MSKPVILTGLRANNDLHIGNYLGALLPIVDVANQKAGEYQINLFVPDLHSFTTTIDHSKLYEQTVQNLKIYAAAGLNFEHPDVHIYRQSFIPAHSELTWILNCFTGFGEMARMIQFKDKSAKLGSDRVSVGLFDYPVLMAADILLYDAVYVPVGDDQSQHLEFTRDIAERFNKQFGETFIIPQPVAKQHQFFGDDQGLRIKDLIDPSKKMSKSDESGKGVIFLTDEPSNAVQKVKGATTDSLSSIKYDTQGQPGLANLIKIESLLSGKSIDEIVNTYAGKGQYVSFKESVADTIENFLRSFQSKLSSVDERKILRKLEESEVKMSEIANNTLLKVQKAVGLRQK